MKRLKLIAINARFVHTNPALFYLKRYIRDLDFETHIEEFTIKEDPFLISKRICSNSPDIIAISVYIWNSAIVDKIIPDIKEKLPWCKIILGGPEVAFNPERWLENHKEIDYIICNGEEAFKGLLVEGLNLKEKKIYKPNPHFNEIPFPYSHEDMDKFKGRFIYYESSRGCPFKCSYCLSSRRDSDLQFKDIEKIKEELSFFKAYNTPLIKFVDRTFNSKKEHYRAIWDYIVKNFSGTRFHFEIYPDHLDQDDLDFLQRVPQDMFQFEMGVQSLNPKTLEAIHRSINEEKLLQNIKKLQEMGNIHLHVDLIAGLPYDSLREFSKSFDRIYSLQCHHLQCGFLKVLPGTEMEEKGNDFGISYNIKAPYTIIQNNWMSKEDIAKLEVIARLLDIYHNGEKFTITEKNLLSLYNSPFKLYEDLANFIKNKNLIISKDWEKAAAILISFNLQKALIEEKLLMDSLRWDWCSNIKLHYYPPLLKSEFTHNIKKKCFSYIEKIINGDNPSEKFKTLSKGDLKQSIFFAPETKDFKGTIHSDYVMFLPNKKAIYFNIEI